MDLYADEQLSGFGNENQGLRMGSARERGAAQARRATCSRAVTMRDPSEATGGNVGVLSKDATDPCKRVNRLSANDWPPHVRLLALPAELKTVVLQPPSWTFASDIISATISPAG